MKKTRRILKEIGKFLISCLCILGMSYITSKVVCQGYSARHPRCIKGSSSERIFECVDYLSSVPCNPRNLTLFLLAILIITITLGLFAKKKKISKSWVIYFLVSSMLYYLAGLVVD